MANVIDRIEKWVRRVLTDPILLRTDEGDLARKPVMLSLLHVTSGMNQEVQTLKLGSKQWEPKQLAEMFDGIANEHSAGLSSSESGSGQEQYKLVVFYSDHPDIPQNPLPVMKKTGPMVTADDAIVTEPPNGRGMTAQDMRHKEGWMQFVLEMSARMHATEVAIIDRLSSRLATVERENQDTIQIAKDMILEKAADSHDSRMRELEYERKSEERKRIMSALPPLANQLLGKEIFPTSTVDTSLVEGLMADLDEKTIQQLAELLIPKLKPETAALLMGRFTQAVEEQNKKKAAEAARATALTHQNGKAS